MKDSNEKKNTSIKQVFSDTKNNFQGSSTYPLGEDFYSFDAGDIVSKEKIIPKTILPENKN